MPDIAMCITSGCVLSRTCHRHEDSGTVADPKWQTCFSPTKTGTDCNDYWPKEPIMQLITKERNKEIVDIAQTTPPVSLQSIANKYGITRERVRQILVKSGVTKLKSRPERVVPPERILARAALNQARDQARRAHKERLEKNRTQKMAQALGLRLRGYTFAEISKEMGFVTPASSYQWVKLAKDAGITVTSMEAAP